LRILNFSLGSPPDLSGRSPTELTAGNKIYYTVFPFPELQTFTY
jgi:hypothetical protein